MHWLTLAIAVVAEVIGTSALKESDGFTKLIPSLLVVSSYAIAFYCLSLTVKTINTSLAYAIWCGAGITLICLFSWLIKGEKLDLAAIIGIILIIAGVVTINLFSKLANH